MRETLSKLGTEFSESKKQGHLYKPYRQVYTQWWKCRCSPAKIRSKTRTCTPTTSTRSVVLVARAATALETQKRRHPAWKRGSKTAPTYRMHDYL